MSRVTKKSSSSAPTGCQYTPSAVTVISGTRSARASAIAPTAIDPACVKTHRLLASSNSGQVRYAAIATKFRILLAGLICAYQGGSGGRQGARKAAAGTAPDPAGAVKRMCVARKRCATPSYRYSPIVRMTLLSGRVLFDDSLSSCASISSYFGTVVTSPFGTMCTTL